MRYFFFSSRRRHTRLQGDWSSDVCSSDLNHLDAESVAWLERFLKEYPGTVVAITHDRYFLDNVAGWILELDQGKGIPWEGNYSSWLEQKRQRPGHEAKAETARQRTLARELEG